MIEPKEIFINDRKFIISKISPLVQLKITVDFTENPIVSILEIFKHTVAFDTRGTKFNLDSGKIIELLITERVEFMDLLDHMLAYNLIFIPKSSPLNHFFDLRFAYQGV